MHSPFMYKRANYDNKVKKYNKKFEEIWKKLGVKK